MKMLTAPHPAKLPDKLADVSGLSLPDIYHKDTLLKIRESIEVDPNIHNYTLTRLAHIYNLHQKTLGRKFNLLFGITISDFIRKKCMQKAYSLITTTDMPLGDIAFELGYSELTNFNRAFKSQFGISPRSLRR